MRKTMYNRLCQLPLFQGLRKEDITSILEKIKISFDKYDSRSLLVKQGEVCDKLYFVLDGEIEIEYTNNEKGYGITEFMTGPCVIEPYSMFGMNTRYSASYYTTGNSNIMIIDKLFVIPQLNQFQIFNLNVMNMLCSKYQNLEDKLWNTDLTGTTEQKVLKFFYLKCKSGTGKKLVAIKMEVLGSHINETRLNVSRVLNKLANLNLVELRRKMTIIPDMERLIEYMEKLNTEEKKEE